MTSNPNLNQSYAIPIVCRFVTTDQWLTTHVSSAWKIADVKHWLLAKFQPHLFPVPNLPKALSSHRKRAVSPIRFASRQEVQKNTGKKASDAYYHEDDYDEDEDDLDDDLYDKYKYGGGPAGRPSTSSAFPLNPSLLGTDQSSSAKGLPSVPSTSSYLLLSFSTGQILEEHYTVQWYSIQPHQLVELYRGPYFVRLPRAFPEEYVQPYFEARAWALRTVVREPDGKLDGGAKWTEEGTSAKLSDGEEKVVVGRDRLSKKRRSKMEWKDRWVVIHQGLFKICRHRNDEEPVLKSNLSSILAVRGAEHLHLTGLLPSHSHLPTSTSEGGTSSSQSSPRDSSKTTVCIMFKSENSVNKSKSNVGNDPWPINATSGGGGWWRRASKDANVNLNLNEGRRGSKTALDSSEDPEQSDLPSEGRDGDDKSQDVIVDDGIWIILDMLEDANFRNIIRLLHREASPLIPTTFLSEYNPFDPSQPFTAPTSPVLPSQGYSFPFSSKQSDIRSPSPISFVSRSGSSVVSRAGSPQSISHPKTTQDGEQLSRPPSIDPTPGPSKLQSALLKQPSSSSTTPKIAYPRWRLSVLKRARKVGLGDVGRAMEWAMYGGIAPGSHAHDSREHGRVDDGKWRGRAGGRRRGVTSMDDIDGDGRMLGPMSESEESEEESTSEFEWMNWTEDIKRRRMKALEAFVIDEKRRGKEVASARTGSEILREKEKHVEVKWEGDWGNGAFGSSSITRTVISSRHEIPPDSSMPIGIPPHSRTLKTHKSADQLIPKRTVRRQGSKKSLATQSPTVFGYFDGEDDADEYEEEVLDGDEEDYNDDNDEIPLSSSYRSIELAYPHLRPGSPRRSPRTDSASSSFSQSHISGGSSHGHQRTNIPMPMSMTSITSTVTVGPVPSSSTSSISPSKKKKRSSAIDLVSPSTSEFLSRSSSKSANLLKSKNSRDELYPNRQRSDQPKPSSGLGRLKLSLPSFTSANANSASTYSHSESRMGMGSAATAMALAVGAMIPAPLPIPVSPLSNTPASEVTTSDFESPRFAHPEESD
ncbi:hypothetical protein C8Q75DRAFT_261660 [Abortiporus biennis]|nr:hypothetical protein C8Q75DRAFT_261660 [Abortiporus biennis]